MSSLADSAGTIDASRVRLREDEFRMLTLWVDDEEFADVRAVRAFPLSELPVRASVMTAVHESWVAERIREAVPGAVIRHVPMGIELEPVSPVSALTVRELYGIPVTHLSSAPSAS